MRVVSIDATRLVIHNGCTSTTQQRWATAVLVLGMVGIYFLVSKIVGNLLYFWGAILGHFLSIVLVCWCLAPVSATFDKISSTVKIEIFGLFITNITEHSFLEVTNIQINNIVSIQGFSRIHLVLKSGKRLYLSNWWNKTKNCQEVLEIIKKF